MNIEMLYQINHELNVRTTPEQADEVKQQLQELSAYKEELEPYFSYIHLWERTTDETGKELYRRQRLSGYWFVSDLDKIRALVDDPNDVVIGNGHPPITIEQAVAELKRLKGGTA